MQQLILDFLPPTLNEQINDARTHWTISAAKKKKYTRKIELIAAQTLKPIDGKIWCEYEWLVKSFARDFDNIHSSSKFIMDALIKAEIIRTDNLTVIQSPSISYFTKSKTDGVILTIYTKKCDMVRKLILN